MNKNLKEKEIDKDFVIQNCEPEAIIRGDFGYTNITNNSKEKMKNLRQENRKVME